MIEKWDFLIIGVGVVLGHLISDWLFEPWGLCLMGGCD